MRAILKHGRAAALIAACLLAAAWAHGARAAGADGMQKWEGLESCGCNAIKRSRHRDVGTAGPACRAAERARFTADLLAPPRQPFAGDAASSLLRRNRPSGP